MSKSKSKRWSEADTVKFVQLYRDQACLWDVTNPTYKNHEMRIVALQQIVDYMGIEGFSVNEARLKVKSLRNTYSQERKKIERYVHTPTMKWFEIMDSMLRQMRERAAANHMEYRDFDQDLSSYHNTDEDLSPEAYEEEEEERVAEDPVYASLPPLPTLKRPKLAETSAPWINNFSGNRRFSERLLDVDCSAAAWNQSREPTVSEEDEFEAFGRYIALGLKNMPIHMAIQCQNELQITITRFRMMSVEPPPLPLLRGYGYACHPSLRTESVILSRPSSGAVPIMNPETSSHCVQDNN